MTAARKKNKHKAIIYSVISIILVAGVITAALFFGHDKKVEPLDERTIGNTAGNIYNGGLFCECDAKVYFANPYDNYSLYSMNPDSTGITLVAPVPVKYISSGGDNLYVYYDDHALNEKVMGISGNVSGIYRISKKRGEVTCLERAISSEANLIGNKVYYQHYDKKDSTTLYYTSLDGKDKGKISDELISPACVLDGRIYYPDQRNYMYLNYFDTSRNTTTLYAEERMYNPVFFNNVFYYVSVDDNYCLYSLDRAGNTRTKLTSDRVDLFNVYGSKIFYQKSSPTDPALIRINLDGSDPEIIAEGNYQNINCTSTYTYFNEYDKPVPVYMVPTLSGSHVTKFEAMP